MKSSNRLSGRGLSFGWDWVGLSMGLVFTAIVGAAATTLIQSAYDQQALRHAARIEDRLIRELTLIESSLRAASTYLQSPNRATPRNFSQFHRAVLGNQPSSARAFAFMLELPEGDVGGIDEILTPNLKDYKELKYPGFRLSPESTTGPLLPVVLAEPPTSRLSVFGYNMGSNTACLDAARRAISNENIAMTPPIVLAKDSHASILIMSPVRFEAPLGRAERGLVAVAMTPGELLAEITPPLEGVDLNLSLQYGSGDDWQQWENTLNVPGKSQFPLRISSTEVELGPFEFADSGFRIGYQAGYYLDAGDVFLIVGPVLLSLLLTLTAFFYLRRVKAEAAFISAELQAKEVALRDAERQAAQAQRMESIGQLTGGVAHDFNNLLSVVMANADLLVDDPRLDSEAKEIVGEILGAATRGGDLTQRLLAFGRQSHLEPETLDLREVVGGMNMMLHRVLPEAIEVETVTAAGLWPVRADRSQLENAILNLAINSRDAMEGQGSLTIEASNMRIDDNYIESHLEQGMKAGRFVMLSVSDTGCGMTEPEVQKAFEPFYTTKEVGQGSGLGLSMVYGFSKQSGGTCHIYSEVDVGTTVKLYFPAADGGGTNASEVIEARTPSADWSDCRVLVVEDDAAVRLVLKKQLERFGLQVATAENGAAGLAQFQSGEPFDLLLSDIVMPGDLQGPDLVNAVLEIAPDMRVVLMSGYPQEALIHGNGVATRFRVLRKPISREELLDALRRELDNDGR